jgi:transcriptional regulator with GAF, ATPase, and Fis domain
VLLEQERVRLQAQNAYLQEEIKSAHNFDEIVGRSPALTAVLDQVSRVAPTDSTVLITGETGTGKELIARAIHSASKRKDRPLIKINCAALPAGLVESELFGHEKGAFTGAIARRVGRFELAEGGTIFLDEVGELPADAQAKLLRVLQEREFDRVGGSVPIKADVRVLAATNRDLLQAVRDKSFREDLYYRLSVFPIHLPPLRERKEDIPLLVHFLAGKFVARIGKPVESVDPETARRLLAYPWPGNVRELENVLERAVILANGPTLEIGPDVLPATPEAAAPAAPSPFPSPGASLEAVESKHILSVLERTGWVIDGPGGAAKVLGLHPNTLRSRLKKLGVTARPLRCQGEERLTGDEVAVRVEALPVALDAVLLERLPLAGDPHAAQVQHRLRPLRRPMHPRPLHAVLDEVTARPLNHPAGDRVTRPQVLVITHPFAVLPQVTADARQRPPLRPLESANRRQPA